MQNFQSQIQTIVTGRVLRDHLKAKQKQTKRVYQELTWKEQDCLIEALIEEKNEEVMKLIMAIIEDAIDVEDAKQRVTSESKVGALDFRLINANYEAERARQLNSVNNASADFDNYQAGNY